jgi:hypothetical protein
MKMILGTFAEMAVRVMAIRVVGKDACWKRVAPSVGISGSFLSGMRYQLSGMRYQLPGISFVPLKKKNLIDCGGCAVA